MSSSSSSSSRGRGSRRVRLVGALYVVHAVACIVVLCSGSYRNGGRKYVPADPSAASDLLSSRRCIKAYVDVHADSARDAGAVVCCHDDGSSSSTAAAGGGANDDPYEVELCSPRLRRLPLSGRLTRFPDAWIVPLAPLMLRLLADAALAAVPSSSSRRPPPPSDDGPPPDRASPLRRLGLYVAVVNFRGWALFLGLNAVEDYLLPDSYSYSSSSSSSSEPCWYRSLLRARTGEDRRDECRGRRFDFSDHVALFYGGILPPALFEAGHSLLTTAPVGPGGYDGGPGESAAASTLGRRRSGAASASSASAAVAVAAFLYLSSASHLAAYRTASYFHTPSEVAAGYVVSLSVQIPLAVLALSVGGRRRSGTRWGRAREILGLTPDRRRPASSSSTDGGEGGDHDD